MLWKLFLILNKNNTLYISVIVSLLHSLLLGHGFGADTLVLLSNNSWQQLNTICYRAQKKKVHIASYDTTSLWQTTARVVHGGRSKTNCYIRFGFDERLKNSQRHDVICTPTQEFYNASTRQWVPAYMLKMGDKLLCANNATKTVACISLVKESLDIFTIEVKHTHTFFVTQHSLLTHNMVIPVAFSFGLSIPFGASAGGAAGGFFGPATFVVGAAIGCAVGALVKIACNSKMPTYTVDTYNANTFEQHIKKQPQIVTFNEPQVALSPDYKVTQQKIATAGETHAEYTFSDDNEDIPCFSTVIHNLPKEKPGCGDTTPQKPLILVTPAEPMPVFQNPGYSPPREADETTSSGGCGVIPDELKDLFNKPLILTTDSNNTPVTEHDRIRKTIDDMKTNAEQGNDTDGKSKQYIKNGDFEDAKRDFESFMPSNVRPIPNGLAGDLPNGHTINVRVKSSEGSPTLEIFNPANKKKIKFRYHGNRI